jgi:hypothetical protein
MNSENCRNIAPVVPTEGLCGYIYFMDATVEMGSKVVRAWYEEVRRGLRTRAAGNVILSDIRL